MWLDEFEELMFCGISNNKKVLKAIKIKDDNMPELFYKYSKVNPNRLESFKNDTLYFSPISTLNDPFECDTVLPRNQIEKSLYKEIIKKMEPMLMPGFKLPIDNIKTSEDLINKIMSGLIKPIEDRSGIEDLIKYTQQAIYQKEHEIPREISEISDEIYRVCCFSTIEDSILMWSHYADNHEGFCVGYNFREIKNDLTELMLPVRYNDKPLDITNLFAPDLNRSLLINALTRKSKQWSYENEWRLIVLSKNKDNGQLEKVPVPKKIFLGFKMCEDRKKEIIEIAKAKDMEVYQMNKKIGEYKLHSERII